MKTILITGGSSGIGLVTAQMLMDKGYKVYSVSRRGGGNAQKSRISAGEIIPLKMDVNDEESIRLVLNQIIAESFELYAVISNAGNGISGAIEDTSSEEVKYQFETNFFGAVKVIQACLPIFRRQGYGKIIATSSVAAIVPIPFQAFYSATKAALQIFMEALSMEVKCFGIQCCTILPGDTKTDFTTSRKHTECSAKEDSPYYKRSMAAVGRMEKDEMNGMDAKVIAKEIVKQVEKRKMNLKVIPGIQYKLFAFLNLILPDRLCFKLIDKFYS